MRSDEEEGRTATMIWWAGTFITAAGGALLGGPGLMIMVIGLSIMGFVAMRVMLL